MRSPPRTRPRVSSSAPGSTFAATLEDHEARTAAHEARLAEQEERLATYAKQVGDVAERGEFIRREMMYEARYGARSRGVEHVEPHEVDLSGIDPTEPLRLNLGSGHVPREGFVNVDSRASSTASTSSADVRTLPFEPGTSRRSTRPTSSSTFRSRSFDASSCRTGSSCCVRAERLVAVDAGRRDDDPGDGRGPDAVRRPPARDVRRPGVRRRLPLRDVHAGLVRRPSSRGRVHRRRDRRTRAPQRALLRVRDPSASARPTNGPGLPGRALPTE